MISMQVGLAATASLNWLIMVSGAQAENCAFSSTPRAAAACAAPVWRASVAPSPALPPICMYMTRPLPIGSAADAAPTLASKRRRGRAGQQQFGYLHGSFSPSVILHRARWRVRTSLSRADAAEILEKPMRAKNARRRCGSST